MNRLAMENIDTASGVVFPFYDEGTNMVYLVGKVSVGFVYIMCVSAIHCAGRHTDPIF